MGFLASMRGLLGGKPGPDGDTAAPLRLTADRRPERVYAIGDVHGCLEQLQALETMIVADAAAVAGEKWIVMLGDYIDRGPRSAQVIDHLIAPPPAGFERLCLRGNHEASLLSSLHDASFIARWLEYGGDATLASYGMGAGEIETLRRSGNARRHLQMLQATIPDEHVRVLSEMGTSLVVPGFVFVHAGLRPGVAISQQTERDMLWIRRDFLDAGHDFGAVVVHGHTPVKTPFISPHRIGIDTGCFMTGQLTALCIDPAGTTRLLQTPPQPI